MPPITRPTLCAALVTTVIAAAFAVPAAADIPIYNNGSYSSGAAHSDLDTSYPSDTVLIGDDFFIRNDRPIREIRFWGIYLDTNTPPAADDFTIDIHRVVQGVPEFDPMLTIEIGDEAKRTDTLDNLFGSDIYEYSAPVLPDLVLPDGHYLLSIYNNTAGTDADWFWSQSNIHTGNAWDRTNLNAPWDPDGREYAFVIIPAAPTLGVLGLAALLARPRRG